MNVGIGDGLQLFLLLRDAPALLHQLAQRFLPDVIGELLANDGGRHLPLPEARQAGPLLIGFRRALLGGFDVVGGDSDFERRFPGLDLRFPYEYLGHVGDNLTW